MSAHNAKRSRRGPPPHSGVATARRPVFNFNSGSAPSPDRCMNQGKSSLIKVNQGGKTGRTRFPRLLKVRVPNHEPKRSLSWNGEHCCGWLSPKPRSDLTVPPAAGHRQLVSWRHKLRFYALFKLLADFCLTPFGANLTSPALRGPAYSSHTNIRYPGRPIRLCSPPSTQDSMKVVSFY
jgi:hypothetical protein